jgi:hypothetical protein
MNTETIQFEDSDAWIFLSVAGAAGGELAALEQIMGIADYINRSIPSERELEGGLTRLLQAGLVHQEGRKLGLTETGRVLKERCKQRSRTPLKKWTFLTKVFQVESFPKVADLAYKLESGEAVRAYREYLGRFNKRSRLAEE